MVNQLFENKIDSKKFTELKVPVHFPTVQDMDEYAVVEGQIQLKNVYYNYVKLKVTRDTLFFVCIANTNKTRLVTAGINTAKEINDISINKKTHHDPAAKKISVPGEYYLHSFEYSYTKFEIFLKHYNKPISYQLYRPFIDDPGKPPDYIS